MRDWQWVGGLLALGIASSAQAGISASTQLCWGADGTVATAFQSCTGTYDGAGGSTASVVSKSTPNPDGVSPDQVFVGTGSATATPDTWRVAMTLDVTNYRRDMYVWTESPSDGTYVATTAAMTAATTDSVTVTGGTGVYSLKYIFSIDGWLASSDTSLVSAQFCASLYMPSGTGTANFFCRSAGQDMPATFSLSYADLPFGGPVDPTLAISVYGLVSPIYASEVAGIGANTITANASAQFGSTIHLTSLLVTDADGAPIVGVEVHSQSGYVYPLDPSNTAPVPEPSTLLLLAGGLGLFGLRRMARGTR